ncbi:hypothetical protein [Mesorhizobium sp. M0060]
MSSLDQSAPFGAAATGGVGARRGATLALLSFAQLIIALDLNIVFVALPEIGAGLGFSGQTLQWWSAPTPSSPVASCCSAAGPPT